MDSGKTGKKTVREWWFSCKRITCLVVCDLDGRVIGSKSAPIVRKFSGQHITNLARWFRKLGGFKFAELQGDNHGT